MTPLQIRVKKILDEKHIVPDHKAFPKCPVCNGYSFVKKKDGTIIPCPKCLNNVVSSAVMKWHDGLWSDWGMTFNDVEALKPFTRNEVYTSCKQLLFDIKNNKEPYALMLFGGNGQGKTICPLAIIKHLMQSNIYGYAISFPTLIAKMKSLKANDYLSMVESRIKESAFVFVDELGKENHGGNRDHPQEALRFILDNCYKKRFLTLSSNLTYKDFYSPDFYLFPGDIFSRLKKDTGYAKMINVPFNNDLRASK